MPLGSQILLSPLGLALVVLSAVGDDGEPSCLAADPSCSTSGPSPVTGTSATPSSPSLLPSRGPAALAGQPGVHVWTVEELALHDGSDPERPLLLACLGEVYNVSAGERFYAKGNGYAGLAGRDSSRAFSTGEFNDTSTASYILDLSDEDVTDILGWCSFYREHKEYTFQGVLAERYYDMNGNPTSERQKLEAVQREANKAGMFMKDLQERFPSCNTKHEAAHAYFEIWCDDSYHGRGSKPVHFYYQIPANGLRKAEDGDWCTCLTTQKRQAETASQLADPRDGTATFRFVDYPECKQKQRCRRPKGSKPP